SGSNAICTTTVLLETGMVPMRDGMNTVRLETAAGLVEAVADCGQGKCKTVTLAMPASFVETLDHETNTARWGTLKADIAFGGVYYAIIDAAQLGLSIAPAHARALSDAGMELKAILNESCQVVHPENPDISGIAYVMFRDTDEDGAVRTATTMWPGRLDRSPCGTGNSANLAVRVARGEVREGETYLSRSTIGSEFQVTHAGTTRVGNKEAVLPRITGRGWIYGIHQIGFDPTDPLKGGFALTDTWGQDAGKIGN
ncbi:MAG: proline racemase family protein, partial [Pseudomonadota bacterium]